MTNDEEATLSQSVTRIQSQVVSMSKEVDAIRRTTEQIAFSINGKGQIQDTLTTVTVKLEDVEQKQHEDAKVKWWIIALVFGSVLSFAGKTIIESHENANQTKEGSDQTEELLRAIREIKESANTSKPKRNE